MGRSFRDKYCQIFTLSAIAIEFGDISSGKILKIRVRYWRVNRFFFSSFYEPRVEECIKWSLSTHKTIITSLLRNLLTELNLSIAGLGRFKNRWEGLLLRLRHLNRGQLCPVHCFANKGGAQNVPSPSRLWTPHPVVTSFVPGGWSLSYSCVHYYCAISIKGFFHFIPMSEGAVGGNH